MECNSRYFLLLTFWICFVVKLHKFLNDNIGWFRQAIYTVNSDLALFSIPHKTCGVRINLISVSFTLFHKYKYWDRRIVFYWEVHRNNSRQWLVLSYLIRGMSLNWGLFLCDLISPVTSIAVTKRAMNKFFRNHDPQMTKKKSSKISFSSASASHIASKIVLRSRAWEALTVFLGLH